MPFRLVPKSTTDDVERLHLLNASFSTTRNEWRRDPYCRRQNKVKTRRRYNEDMRNVNRKAFRVCIYEYDCDRFLNPNAWPHSVRISEWFSKRNPVRAAGGEKRIRVGSGEHVISEVTATQHSAIQQPPSEQQAVIQTSVLPCCDSDSSESRAGGEDNDDTIIDDSSMECSDVIIANNANE